MQTVTADSRSPLFRARFFLQKADTCSVDELVDFEAFADAAIVFSRAAVHHFRKAHQKHQRWDAGWWKSIETDPAVEFCRSERNRILKDTPPKLGTITQEQVIGPDGQPVPRHAPALARECYYIEDESTPATATIAKHLDALQRILSDAGSKLGTAPRP